MTHTFSVALAIASLLCAGLAPQAHGASVGPLPLKALSPDNTELTVLLSGRTKPLLLVFWASWCGRCNKEAAAIESLHKATSAKLEVVSISVDKTPEKAKGFIAKFGVTSAVLMDSSLKVSDRFSVRGTPAILLLDKAGTVIARGHSLDENMRTAISKALKPL